MHRIPQTSQPRRAAATLEAILVVPLLALVFFGAFEFGVIVLVHESVENAADEAVREAALVPSDLVVNPTYWTDVQVAVTNTVNTVLGVFGMNNLTAPNSGVMVIIEDSTQVTCLGDTVKPCPALTTITDPAEIQVTVLVKFPAARIPNFLAIFGVDLSAKRFEIKSLARKQT